MEVYKVMSKGFRKQIKQAIMGQSWGHLTINSNFKNVFNHIKCLNPKGHNGIQRQQNFIE